LHVTILEARTPDLLQVAGGFHKEIEHMERKQILKILQDDVTYAKQQLDGANQAFEDVVREVPSMLPHADGIQRIKNVSRDLTLSRDKLNKAVARLNDFALHGTIPHDLQKKPAQNEGGDWRTRSSSG
jgi:coenzyme F420-reducing hydrogenase alpha subunit